VTAAVKPMLPLRQRLLKRLANLEVRRSTYLSHWKEISQHMRPRGSRYYVSQANKDDSGANDFVINSTPVFSVRTLAAGMLATTCSPSRPWFRLTTQDITLSETEGVKLWLRAVEDRFRVAMARSNFYQSVSVLLSDLAPFGTAAMHTDEDAHAIIRCYVWPNGSYLLDCNDKGEVDTCVRSFAMTVRQLVGKFGKETTGPEGIPASVLQRYNEGDWETEYEVVHWVAPGADLDRPEWPWASVWFLKGGSPRGTTPGMVGVTSGTLDVDMDRVLRRGGYYESPICSPRWEVTGEDVYGHSPGMQVLGDCKALQELEREKGRLVELSVNPPMGMPAAMEGYNISLLPGSVTWIPETGKGMAAPLHQVDPRSIQIVGAEVALHERRIEQGCYADLWLLLSRAEGQMTATEVLERREEKLLQLGAVLERLSNELYDPFFERLFGIMLRRAEIPPPPRELQGQPLRVEYLNAMAAAQRLHGAIGVEKLTTFAANLAQVNPAILDKVDFDQTVDEYSAMLGVPPSMVRADDDVEVLRQQRSQAQAKQAQMQQAMQSADALSKLGRTPVGDPNNPNAVDAMLGALGAPVGPRGG
jgi:hypothetical protein